MSFRFALAKAAGAVTTWGCKHVAHRPAANLPGKVALKIDPALLDHLRNRFMEGCVITVGTNGKTSTNNLLADAFERAGKTVVCNRTGANLASGVSSALMQSEPAEWAVLECDELWLAHVLPHLRADYVVLLNLFRDQLDRCGEIDRIQSSIISALSSSAGTVLIYNGDDPLCAAVANAVDNEKVAFGLAESMELAQNTVADAQMCQSCSGMIAYNFRQYGQLGDYYCEQCGFSRPPLSYAAHNIVLNADGVALDIETSEATVRMRTPQATTYAAYNLVAAFAACAEIGIAADALQAAVDAFDPRNGRLQRYRIDGRPVLLNLAKNPTGFNQNLKIVEADTDPKVVGFFINDNVADGRDISWIWDIDFEELAAHKRLLVVAGGTRAHDVQVRLKYAGVDAVIGEVDALFEAAAILTAEGMLSADAGVYAIANYTALPAVHDSLDAFEAAGGQSGVGDVARDGAFKQRVCEIFFRSADATCTIEPSGSQATACTPIVVAHLLPDLLNLYGDGGNVRVLEQRLAWRGIPAEIRRVRYGQDVDLSQVDLVFMGGGPDREQKLATEQLLAMRDDIVAYVEEDGPLLAICGGYQILGRQWLWGDELVEGLCILDIETRRPGTSADRLIGNMVLDSPLAAHPVVGYENHAGRTYLGAGVESFGRIHAGVGFGNNDDDKAEGARCRNVVGTYSHGPLLSKNPEVADWLLAHALKRHAQRTGEMLLALKSIDDSVELAANESLVHRLTHKSS